MAINKKLIHFKTRQKFDEELAKGNILDTSIVFIQDTTEIYTHKQFYDGSTFDPSNLEESIYNLTNNKVDKISGKGLSTNDYTTTEKNKLASIASGAEVNVQSDWNITDSNSDAYIKNKPIIDSELSTTSSNAIQNKVVTAGINAKYTKPSNGIPKTDLASGVQESLEKADTSAQQFYIQKALSKEGWYRIGLLTAIMSTSSARIVVGGTNADVSPIIMDFQHNFRGDTLSQMPTVMTPLYVTKVRAVRKTSDDVYVDLYFTNVSSSLTTVSVFPLEGEWESMNFIDVTSSAGGTVATQIDIVKDGFLDGKVNASDLSTVATSGSYNDLKDKPTIPSSTSELNNDSNYITSAQASNAYVSKKGGVLNDNATLKLSSYGDRFLTISGNRIDADLSNTGGMWSGKFVALKDSKGDETTIIGWYGSQSDGLSHAFMGGSYNDAAMKMTKSGEFTFKYVPKVGNDSLVTTNDISGKLDSSTAASTYLTKTDAATTYLGISAKAANATKADSATKATQDESGNVITSTYATKSSINAKQDAALKFENISASTWLSDSTYEDFPYRCDIACSGVTSSMYAEVVFGVDEAISGDYAPMCETKSNMVSIWSAKDETITVPTILITK